MGESTVKAQAGRKAGSSPFTDEVAETTDTARDTETEPAERRTLVQRLRTPRKPRFWFEILLIAASYWIYSLIRNAVPEQRTKALENADWIWHAERTLGLGFERAVNHGVNSVTWL